MILIHLLGHMLIQWLEPAFLLIKPVSATSGTLLKGLSHYVARGTVETCLHLNVLSLCVVMAGSGHLQTFKLLRFLRGKNCADRHVNYGVQMATYSTSNSQLLLC